MPGPHLWRWVLDRLFDDKAITPDYVEDAEDYLASHHNTLQDQVRLLERLAGDRTVGGGVMSYFLEPTDPPSLSLLLNPAVGVRAADGTALADASLATLGPFTVPGTNPYIALVSVNNAGTITITYGTQATSPTVPAVPAGGMPLWEIYIRPGATAIDAYDYGEGYISKDRRRFVGGLDTPITSAMILDGTIVNADINASAAIAYSKLNLSGSIVSADIANGTIVDADVNSSAAIAETKVAGDAVSDAGSVPANNNAVTDLITRINGILAQIKAITGGANWFTAPAASIATIWGKFNGTTGHAHTGAANDGPVISGSALTVREVDTAPSVSAAILEFPNGTLTDHGSGRVEYIPASGASAYTTIDNAGTPVTARTVLDLIYGLLAADNGGTSRTDLSVALATASAQLTSDVTLTAANTYYDGPSVSLAAGTWLVLAKLNCYSSTGTQSHITARLWDGSSVYEESEQLSTPATGQIAFAVFAPVTLGSTTTVKASAAIAATSGTPGVIQATVGQNGTTNKATNIVAIRVA